MIVTDHAHVSALLFHGFALPPWYDLPAIQKKAKYRLAMTRKVNKLIRLARKEGFSLFEVHEAFPVDLMTISAAALVIRGVDRFLPKRRYHGVALLKAGFKDVGVQPRKQLIKKMILGQNTVSESDLIALYFAGQKVPVIYSDYQGAYIKSSHGKFYPHLESRLKYPAIFRISFEKSINLKPAAWYLAINKVAKNMIVGKVRNAGDVMEIYRFAGLLVEAARKY